MEIDLNKTYDILCEDQDRVLSSKDKPVRQNKFRTRPQGILIQDTYNNPFFPISRPKIDTSKLDLHEVFKKYREFYAQKSGPFLPWHYCVEMIDDRYYIFNTRPTDMRFPLSNTEVSQMEISDRFDDMTKMFFKDNIFDIREALHICIIGNSKLDVYTIRLYNMLATTCIIPFVRYHKIPNGMYQRIFPLNLGRRFNLDMITKFIRS